jgi:hypothetical protein
MKDGNPKAAEDTPLSLVHRLMAGVLYKKILAS